MYVLLIFNDFKKQLLNAIYFFNTIKDIIKWSKGIIKYNDIQKNQRKYNTYKCFFKIIEVHPQDEIYYFPKFKKFYKRL